MYRLGYIAMFAGLTVMAQDCYDVCKKCNRSSQELKPVDIIHLYPQLHFPLIQDTPYLLEEDFIKNKQNHQHSLNRNNRNLLPEYHNLCETITKKVQLDDSEYEYQPPYYHEIYCKSYNLLDNLRRAVNLSKQKCVHNGFHCVQRSKTLLLVRRRWDNECWEPFIKQIASGCDCMWPVSVLGDITDHY